MRRRILLSVGLVALVGLLGIAISTAHAAASELSAFHPAQRSPPPPTGLAVVPVSFRTERGDEVKGWWVPPRNGAAVLLTHGGAADRAQLDGELKILAGAGFGALAIDWPGHGESGGEVKLGGPERSAFKAAIDWLLQQAEVRPKGVGAFGISNGAALVTAFAADDGRVTAVVAAGGFTDAMDQTYYEYHRSWPWSRAAALWVVRQNVEGGNFRPIDVAYRLRGRRTLFVTFEQDPVVPPTMADDLAVEAGGGAYRIPGEGHATYAEGGGQAYAEKLVTFFSRALVR